MGKEEKDCAPPIHLLPRRDVRLVIHAGDLAPQVEGLELLHLLGEIAEEGVHALTVRGLHLRKLLEHGHRLRELAIELHALLS